MSNPTKKSRFRLLGVSPKLEKIENEDTVNMLILLGKIFCLTGIAFPLITIIIWSIDTELYLKLSPLQVGMNPMTALLIIMLGLSIWLVRKEKIKAGWDLRISRITSVIVFSISSYFFLEMFWEDFNVNYETPEEDIYNFLYGKKKYLNYMAPNTAISLILLSISVFLIEVDSKKIFRFGQFLSYAVLFLSILYIYGYAYQIKSLYQVPEESPMAFFTACSFFLLASSMPFLRPHKGSMAVIIGQNPTQVILLRFLAFLIPLCLGYLKLKGTEKEYYSSEIGTAIFAAITFIISMTLLGWKSTIQHKLRKERNKSIEKIKQERERFFRVLNCSPTNIILFDYKKDHVLFINDVAKHRFKMDSDKIDLSSFKKAFVKVLNSKIHSDDKEKLLKQQKRIEEGKLNRGYFDELEYRIQTDKDSIRWMYSRTIPFKKVGDEIITAISNSVDITSQKEKESELDRLVRKKEKELMKTKDKLKFVTSKMFHGVFHYKLDNIEAIDLDQEPDVIEKLMADHLYVDKTNMEAVRMFGFDSKSEIEGLKLGEMMNFGNFKKFKVFENLIENDFRIQDMDVVYTKKDGSSVKLKTSVIGIIENNKLVEGYSTTEKM